MEVFIDFLKENAECAMLAVIQDPQGLENLVREMKTEAEMTMSSTLARLTC